MAMTQSGILLIDKPEGPSSAQVVNRVKKILRAEKVGHLGTLDPFASGLLLVGVNEGTKIADLFLGGEKTYRGVMVLGVETDSQDATGKIIGGRAVPAVSEAQFKKLEASFTGEQEQVPPMFSALKKGGVRLYQLARQGKEIPRAPRAIRIASLQIKKISGTELEFSVTCSRGTYVRTLAADMGQALGCGAHLKSLRRTACDHLKIEQSMSLEELEQLCATGTMPLTPLGAVLGHLRALTWQTRLLSRLRLGQQEVLTQIGKPQANEKLVALVDPRGQLAALAEWSNDVAEGRWRLFRVFRE